MSDFNWYKRYPKKFIGGVVGMGPALIGCYAVVLDLIYEHEGSCPNDAHWIGGIMGCSGQQATALIRALITRGKLHLTETNRLTNPKADSVLAERSQRPSSARAKPSQSPSKARTDDGAARENNNLGPADKTRLDKTRTEKKKEAPNGAVPVGTSKPPPPTGSAVPTVVQPTELGLAVQAFNEAAALCPATAYAKSWAACATVNGTREKQIRARLKEVGLDGWRAAMTRAARSDFLAGRVKRSHGHENWRVDLTWLSKAENFTKVVEGKYDNGGPARQLVGQESTRAGLMDFLNDQREGE